MAGTREGNAFFTDHVMSHAYHMLLYWENGVVEVEGEVVSLRVPG